MRRWKLGAAVVAGVTLAAAAVGARASMRALNAQDYVEIQQLYARYAWAVDTHASDGMAYAATYAPDGEFRLGDMTVKGHDALAAYNLKMGTANRAPTHFVTNLVIEPSSDGAHGSAYLFITTGEKPTLAMVGTYRDLLVKTSGGWRFKQRTLYLNAMPPAQ